MRVIQKEILRKWKEIAEKHNVSLDVVKNVETTIWDFVKERMGRGEKGKIETFDNIYLRYLGTFYVHKGKFKYMKHDKDTGNT
jgi:hypothetical protein